ncbi:MAG: hypothetical protein OEW29_10270, partial [Acidimicrobiia bacterium]|nr:hypothetical protein [Acidimicrobiia bacterium]
GVPRIAETTSSATPASRSSVAADVASFVGHSDVATTRGYVQHEGDRPLLVSLRALEFLDPPGVRD